MDTDLENVSKVIENNDSKQQDKNLLKIDETNQSSSATSVSGKISVEKVVRLIYSPSDTNYVPVPPVSQPQKKIMVRKFVKKDRSMDEKNTSIDNSQNKIKVLVAHKVNESDSQLKSKVPSKDYHVLGSLEEYNARKGVKHVNSGNVVPFEEKSIEVAGFQSNQTNALNNWTKKMSERKILQKHLSESLSVHKDNLVMGQSDQFRNVQEQRMVIERTMPFLNSGKGNRVGSEFWKQAEFLKKNQDVSITLTKEEKGNFLPIEHIGLSSFIMEEMATQGKNTTRSNKIHLAWSKSSYFKKRLEELQSAINVMNLYEPSMEGLEVIGNSLKTSLEERLQERKKQSYINVSHQSFDVYSNEEDVSKDLPKSISGPSLLINGQCANYIHSLLKEDSGGITIRLLFEAEKNNCQTRTIKITNQGTTAMHFNWKKLKEKDPFGLKKVNSKQKFYFDISHGVILPGAELKIPFYFKSSIPGIFSEIWHFETKPLLCGGAKIEVILRAISFENVQYKEKLLQLDTELNARQIKTMSKRIVSEIVNGVRTPPRPSSPIEQRQTIEEVFNQVNPTITYCVRSFNVLNELYKEIGAESSWDFSINTIYKLIASTLESNKKEEWLRRLNIEVSKMKMKANVPLSPSNYNCCYNILSLWIDSFVTKSIDFRSSLGLEEKQITIKFENDMNKKKLETLKPEIKPELTIGKKEAGTPISKTPKEKQKKNVVKEEEIKVIEPTFTEMLLTVTAEKNLDDPKYKRYLQFLYAEVYDSLRRMAVDLELTLL